MGIRNVAKRIRVRLERRRDEDEEAKEKVFIVFFYCLYITLFQLYTLVKHVQVADFKGLQTQNVEA